MRSKILIINCPSEYFIHIPLGTFGLCDYLNQKGIQARILNLALYKIEEIEDILVNYISLFKPSYIGMIFHWQETAEAVLRIGKFISDNFNNVEIIYGGITAGYFAKDLLEKYNFIDFVIKGDPEKPLELLINQASIIEIPNIFYRDNNTILSNDITYHIDKHTLSNISFSKVEYLYDYELYLNAVEGKLGFPIFIGRGCIFNCRYCGGSASSFRLHSNRERPVVRSIEAIIKDLKIIKNYTEKIYICYENDQEYIKELFKEIKRDNSLIKSFYLNYGTWQLFDDEFLKLYKDIFICKARERAIFEISPEIFNDNKRKKIKQKIKVYSIKDIVENVNLINNHLDKNIQITIFFSRYHENVNTYADIKEEIKGIFRLKHLFRCNNIENTNVQYDHLSTDVASQYWEHHVKNREDLDTLLLEINKNKTKELYPFTFNNLSIYIPDTLSTEDIIRCELLINILNGLEQYFNEMFHIFFHCLDEMFINILEDIITERYIFDSKNVFEYLNYCELLNNIKQKFIQNSLFISKIPFFDDMMSLFFKKCKYFIKQLDLPKNTVSKSDLRLNHELISINDYDYLDLLGFLKKLKTEGIQNLSKQKTVFIFLKEDIICMPYETYKLTIKEFENGMSLKNYYGLMEKRMIFSILYHEDLIRRLLNSRVLY